MSNLKCQINTKTQKKKNENFWQSQVGFTLIELLVVISLMSILTLSSITVFFSYTKSQSYQTTVADVVSLVNKARDRSLAQVKPSDCGINALQAYELSFVAAGVDYQLRALCGGSTHVIETKQLPAGITFAENSVTTIRFNALTAVVNSPGDIIVTGFDKTSTIRVDSIGSISIQ